ncbi:hypothetical protein Dda_4276 [Drechslerella dactyloides]|uniref:Uncharacterized protein n=1 Tax=Drechslerella dactyloides TaxID=74499 RepID=A0AAD6IZX0_DREDA|nr:hypothetical protein Dda_4276 [Drechslerella dactyloides]
MPNISAPPTLLPHALTNMAVIDDDPTSRSTTDRMGLDSSRKSADKNAPLSSPQHLPLPPRISGDITRTLHFFRPPRYGSPPRFLVAHPNGSGIKNFGTIPIVVPIRDIRNKEHRFHLALHSFKPVRHLQPLPYPLDLKNTDVIAIIHNSTTEILQRHVSSPNQITIFSTGLLKARSPIGSARPTISHPLQIDQTPKAALLRAKRHLSPVVSQHIASGTLSLRVINLYRPVLPRGVGISDHQLCVTESLTISEDDLASVEHVYPDRIGQTYAIRHAKGQRFWYWSNLDSTEGILVQVYDSLFGCDADGRERMVRGGSGFFRLMPEAWEESQEAEWLVVRALVVA